MSATKHKYTLTVTNAGPNVATDVVMTDRLPKNYVVGTMNGGGATCTTSGRKVTCTIATLNVAARIKIVIHATPNGATGKNCAKVTAGTPDPNPTNNKACAAVP